jgi:hypothetical protein
MQFLNFYFFVKHNLLIFLFIFYFYIFAKMDLVFIKKEIVMTVFFFFFFFFFFKHEIRVDCADLTLLMLSF